MAKRTTPKTSSTTARLRNALYDLRVKDLKPSSKFYDEDCESLWRAISRKSDDELRESLAFWRGVNAVTPEMCARHCDFRGLL